MSILHIALAIVLAATALVSVAGENMLRRRLTNYRPLQILAVLAGPLLSAANMWAAFSHHAGHVVSVIIATASGAVLIAMAAVYTMSKLPRTERKSPRRILAIGAHPDDLELAAGGTLARLADAGHEIHSMVMSCGHNGGDADIRIEEAKTGARFLGATECDVHDFTDTNLESDMTDMIHVIEKKIKDFNPDIIMTHSANDQHQDHHAVHLAVLRAGRRHPAILCFESPSVTLDFKPQIFVDIEDYVHVKAQAVSIHKNQAGKPYMSGDRVAGMAAFRGDQSKLGHAEGFEAVRFDALKGVM